MQISGDIRYSISNVCQEIAIITLGIRSVCVRRHSSGRLVEITRSFPMHTHKTSQNVLNSDKRTEWRLDGPTPRRCVWEMHSVWGWDKTKGEGIVLHENYFTRHPTTGRKVWLSLSALLECFMIIPRLRWYMDFTILP